VVEFYKAAFGAEEVYRVGGTDAHEAVVSQLRVGATPFWVADESPEHRNFSPESLGGGSVRLLLTNEHGWRLGRIADPFGHDWEVGCPLAPWPPGA
jgi:PhnB protein